MINDLIKFINNTKKKLKYSFDSRNCDENTIFFALKGEKVDGHDFLPEITKKSVSGAVVSNDYTGDCYGTKLFYVPDVLIILQKLAKRKLASNEGKRIGITGSVGKTTTKEMLFTILNQKEGEKVVKTCKSYNSQRGFPISVLNFEDGYHRAVLEMGMSYRGEMEKLKNIANVDIAIILKIGLVHIGNFNNLDEVIKEKLAIIGPNTKKIITHYSNKKYLEIFLSKNKKRKTELITFSIEDKNADYFLEISSYNDKKEITIYYQGKIIEKFSPFFTETHLLENFLACYVAAKIEDVQNWQIEKAMKSFSMPKMRFEKIEKDGVLFIKDCYNSNPISLKAALQNLPNTKSRKIAVIGEMKELGKYSKKAHEEIATYLKKHIDILFCYGKECLFMKDIFGEDNFYYFDELKMLKETLFRKIQKNDLILIKGSRSSSLEKIIDF